MLFIILTVVVAAGCSASPSKKVEKVNHFKFTADEHKPYVGFLIDTLKDERWYKDKALFEEQVKALGGQVKTLAANGLDDVQIKQAELLIAEGVDVLVVVPHDAVISAKIVDIAHKAGVKVISYDRLIKNAKVDYYISFDNEKVGELQATEILKNVSSGNFAYIGGADSDNNAILFRQGAMKVLKPLIDQGKIKLVFDQYTKDWDPKVAQQNMMNALKQNGNKINAVVAANDGTAGGVIDALTSAGLAGKVPVSGQDSELAAIRRILKGTQTMTIYKSIKELATKSAEMAIQVAKGEKVQTDTTINNGAADIPSVFLTPVVITKNNIRDTVIKDGFLSEADVFKP
ncbi:substrate-binding domain-containing protein [Bacillus sp. BRMEA1]|uniref:sugar ABC transporter substrate-binding protein n=1 Tax=Neobacillus endophyticus TaxID=2738405 RepID=UPI001566171D|nr:substrate-binding domain-containing protein [Neobacillus endophyticus]